MPFAEAEYEAMEGLESEFESEAAERARGGRIRKPSGQPSFKPRPNPNTPMYVTQPQLESALTRVDGKIKTVSDGVSTINARVGALASSVKKEAEERKKTAENQNRDLNQKLQLLALLPLLVQSPTATITTTAAVPGLQINGQPSAAGSTLTVSAPDTNNLDALLPVLLVSGLGSAGGLSIGGDGTGGADNSALMLALVLAIANK
jgi:outer membrane murein-binding lipoprotein Lpp